MSDEKKDGGFAFPYQFVGSDREPCEPMLGMTLRDWFAGQALPGLTHHNSKYPSTEITQQTIAGCAYGIADAMLKERSK